MSLYRRAIEVLLSVALTPAHQQPAAAIWLEGGGSGQPPCKELYQRKTDFLSVKSSFLFKFHQST